MHRINGMFEGIWGNTFAGCCQIGFFSFLIHAPGGAIVPNPNCVPDSLGIRGDYVRNSAGRCRIRVLEIPSTLSFK